MANVIETVKLFNFSSEDLPNVVKFFGGINPSILNDEYQRMIDLCASKGITIKPSSIKALYEGYNHIEKVINDYELAGELNALIENPNLLNNSNALNRIDYLKGNSVPYKNEKGKYSKLVSSKRLFEQKYGVVNFTKKVENVVTEEATTKPTIEPVIAPVIEPVVSSPVQNNSEIQEMAAVETSENEPENLIDEIMSKPQTIGLTDEMFEKYEMLTESIRHVLIEVYNFDEVPENITDKLIKLIICGQFSDNQMMFYALTYQKDIPDVEKARIMAAINDELTYVNYSKELAA